jgi:hypothetical protein
MNRLISTAILITAVSIAAGAQAQDTGTGLTVNFSDPSRPGLLKVNLFNGSISVKTHSGRDVIIEGTAVSGSRRTPPTTADGLRRIGGGGAGLTVEEENNVMSVSNLSPAGGGNLEIQVPTRTNLSLKTTNGGRVVVDGVEGDIEITSLNGSVMLTNVAGSVIANATNGRLTASLREVAPNKMMSFASMNANVDVTLPPTTKANLKIRTDNGAAYSDFDIQIGPSSPPTVEKTGGRNRIQTDGSINGTINGGGPEVEIRTLNGNIYLRKAK